MTLSISQEVIERLMRGITSESDFNFDQAVVNIGGVSGAPRRGNHFPPGELELFPQGLAKLRDGSYYLRFSATLKTNIGPTMATLEYQNVYGDAIEIDDLLADHELDAQPMHLTPTGFLQRNEDMWNLDSALLRDIMWSPERPFTRIFIISTTLALPEDIVAELCAVRDNGSIAGAVVAHESGFVATIEFHEDVSIGVRSQIMEALGNRLIYE